jgi:nicotinamide-nucleotide amidase
MTTRRELKSEAKRLAVTLAATGRRVVFAESCTGGLISQILTEVSGISEYLCGSAVVYRIGTKAAWLGVDEGVLKKPGPVSRIVAEQMAVGVLEKTPEASVAASVTGHLGPNALKRQDGLIYSAVALRNGRGKKPTVVVRRHRLEPGQDNLSDKQAMSLRLRRQREAALFVMQFTREVLG